MNFLNVSPFVPKDTPEDPFSPKSMDEDFGLTNSMLEGAMPIVYGTGMTLITIVFVVAVIVLVMAMIFKNGQWTKWSTGVMITTLIFILFLRGLPILFFSSDAIGWTVIIDDGLRLAVSIGIYVSLTMLLVGLLFRLNYKLINHKEYLRWSKRLYVGSVLTAVLITVMPSVLLGI
jgi:hypothetical protein